MSSLKGTIKKLQTAINTKYQQQLTYHTSQFYSKQKDNTVTRYTIKKAVYNPEKDKNQNIELFGAYSPLQLVYFLRDYWYTLEGTEIPNDNEKWNKIKEDNHINYEEYIKLGVDNG